jgi:hypothetical protein
MWSIAWDTRKNVQVMEAWVGACQVTIARYITNSPALTVKKFIGINASIARPYRPLWEMLS